MITVPTSEALTLIRTEKGEALRFLAPTDEETGTEIIRRVRGHPVAMFMRARTATESEWALARAMNSKSFTLLTNKLPYQNEKQRGAQQATQSSVERRGHRTVGHELGVRCG